MAHVHDIAALILERLGPMSAMKLQKLVYYSQAWTLTLRARDLFRQRIEAWAYGPVCPELYRLHRQAFALKSLSAGDPSAVQPEDAEFVLAVAGEYSLFSAEKLSEMTHEEEPWRAARHGTDDGAPSRAEITQVAMRAYYSQQTPPFQF